MHIRIHIVQMNIGESLKKKRKKRPLPLLCPGCSAPLARGSCWAFKLLLDLSFRCYLLQCTCMHRPVSWCRAICSTFSFFSPYFPFCFRLFLLNRFLSLGMHLDCCLLVKIDSCVSPSSSGDLSRHPVPYSLTHACSSRWLYSSCRERRMVWNMTGLKSTAFDPWVVVSVVSFHAVHFRSADDRFGNIDRSAYHEHV